MNVYRRADFGDVPFDAGFDGAAPAYTPAHHNWSLSPYTGLDRLAWIEAGEWLLQRYFQRLDPRSGEFDFFSSSSAGSFRSVEDVPLSRRFEAFTRVFILIGALLGVRSGLRVRDIDIAELAAESIQRYLSPASPKYIGMPSAGKSPFQLVQWIGLLTGFWMGGKPVWEGLPASCRTDALDNLSACAHHRTNAHNWRFFNVLAMAFLWENGRSIDEHAELEHLQQLLCWYAGDGWYRDGDDFDYYNAWAFQTYAALWSSLPRAAHYPEIRHVLLDRFDTFIRSYPRFFSAHGHSLLWGRSSVYRFAASTPLAAAFLNKEPAISGGEARRIMSGNLLQFITRPDVFTGGIPSLGFYGAFPPMLQHYSAPGSFGWMHKAFLCLTIPADDPFWAEPEVAVAWSSSSEAVADYTVSNRRYAVTHLAGPGLTLVNYAESGATILLPGKVRAATNMCYNRVAYHSSFLAEADAPLGSTAMAYSAANLDAAEQDATVSVQTKRIRYAGFRNGVLYRQVFLGIEGGHHSEGVLLDTADLPVVSGIIHIVRVRASFPYRLSFGSFGIPGRHNVEARAEIQKRNLFIDTYAEPSRRGLGLINLLGWDAVRKEYHQGTNPESEQSTVLALETTARREGHASLQICAAFQVLESFDAADMPLIETGFVHTHSGSPLPVRIIEANGKVTDIDFGHLEGELVE